MGNVTHYAKVWLNISAELRPFLEEGKLHNHLAWLQQVRYHQLMQHLKHYDGGIEIVQIKSNLISNQNDAVLQTFEFRQVSCSLLCNQ